MQYLHLPGFSLHNREFSRELVIEMKKRGIEMEVLEWVHWQTGNSHDFQLAQEVQRVDDLIQTQPFAMVAKSIGTLVSAAFILQTQRMPEKLVWLGVPFNDLDSSAADYYVQLLKNYPELKVTILQNVNDPHARFQTVKKLLSPIRPDLKIISTPGSDHNYPFYDLIHQALT